MSTVGTYQNQVNHYTLLLTKEFAGATREAHVTDDLNMELKALTEKLAEDNISAEWTITNFVATIDRQEWYLASEEDEIETLTMDIGVATIEMVFTTATRTTQTQEDARNQLASEVWSFAMGTLHKYGYIALSDN